MTSTRATSSCNAPRHGRCPSPASGSFRVSGGRIPWDRLAFWRGGVPAVRRVVTQ